MLLSLPFLLAGNLTPAISHADSDAVRGTLNFKPIAASAYNELTDDAAILNEATWIIPEGFKQTIISDEFNLDIYSSNDWPDMNTMNETGKKAGRFLYRTHEVRPGNDQRNDGGLGGSLSVVDLKTGDAKELYHRDDLEALDGLVWTPWQTLLFAEETTATVYPDPEIPSAPRGLLYELTPNKKDPSQAEKVDVRPLLGSLSHEGIEFDDEGNIYVIDEDRSGSVYKFVPDTYGDLSQGKLFALKVANGAQTGAAEWLELTLDPVTFDAHQAADDVGATAFCRPEDLERIGNVLYAALTCEPRVNGVDGPGAVLSVALGGAPVVNYFVEVGKNIGAEDPANGVTGFFRPDNLAKGPDGKLWIVEDNVPSDIWVADADQNGDGAADNVNLFASMKDNGAEGTGIYFGKNSNTLFVNVQHSATGNDKTMIITSLKTHQEDHDNADHKNDKDDSNHKNDNKDKNHSRDHK
ncbi:MAG: phosphatase [Gammaproteobacteria bacterium HGW-Gammaproteobacteria-3]|nr:MAG: phosphatase [Gammaproteobacteria bacterium HGW-Gammaproteobacteria-3]